MPAEARPHAAHHGAHALHRFYADALGRPMTGTVRITGAARAQDGHRVTVPAAVTVEVTAGHMACGLPAGTYQLAANLTTVDGHRADDTETVTLG